TIEVSQAGKKALVRITRKLEDKPATAETEPKIKIDKPEKCTAAACPKYDASAIDAYLLVDDSIKKIGYEIFKDGATVFTGNQTPVDKKGTVRVQIIKGENIIRFFDAEDPSNGEKQAFAKVICEGSHCADDFLVSTIPTNSEHARIVVGMEQV